MKLSELVNVLDLRVYAGQEELAREISGGYCGDLLSWVMGRAQSGDIWITIMNNLNTVAVAIMTDVSAVLMAEGVDPGEDVIARAREKGVVLLGSTRSAFELAGAIYNMVGDGR